MAQRAASYLRSKRFLDSALNFCYTIPKKGGVVMKKIFTLILAFMILATTLISCAPKGRSVEDCCADVVSLMKEMVDSEEYLKMYNVITEYDDTITQLKSGNYASPDAIYELDVSESELLSDEIDAEKLSDELNRYVHSASYVSLASRVNQTAGVDSLSVSSVFTAQKTCVCESVKENTSFLYVYEDGCAILLTVQPGESGSVRICGQFIIHDNFHTDDATQIENSFAEAGINGVVAEKK